jgi:hypothetical protein
LRAHSPEHEFEKTNKTDNTTTEEISWMAFVIFEWEGEVKRIDTLSSIDADIEVTSSNSVHESLVFVFGIDDDNIVTEHETTEDFEFYRKRFTAS